MNRPNSQVPCRLWFNVLVRMCLVAAKRASVYHTNGQFEIFWGLFPLIGNRRLGWDGFQQFLVLMGGVELSVNSHYLCLWVVALTARRRLPGG
jgi:hypothetical protein